jgi:hypothetical protein
MPSSHIRMVQLFFTEETEPVFRGWARQLASKYGTDNITDTVYKVFEATVGQQEGLGG